MSDVLPHPQVRCEGSDLAPRRPARMNAGECQVCGSVVTCRDDPLFGRRPELAGTCWPHDRNDVVAILEAMHDDRTTTRPGPANGIGKICPWPGCRERLDFELGTPDGVIEAAIRGHLDGAHPGWTVEDLEAHYTAWRISDLFRLRP